MSKFTTWLRYIFSVPEPPVRTVRATSVAIYCGDCTSPNRQQPVRTVLTTDRRCSGCGGRSYVLASLYAPIVARRLQSERAAAEVPVYVEAPRAEWKGKGQRQ
jgi:hypothetical protein